MIANEIYTVGHSTRSLERFVALLSAWSINAIADVRSSPWSRFNPHFNRPDLRQSLKREGVEYRFFGKQLGGRPDLPQLYRNGIADYEAMARQPEFDHGLDLVIAGAKKHRLALMCSEHDPIDCHRCLLVGRALSERGYALKHILSEETIHSQSAIEDRIMSLTGTNQSDFLRQTDNALAYAYREWSNRVAYTDSSTITKMRADTLRHA